MRTLFGTMILILTATVFCGTVSASDPFLYAGDNYTGTLHKIDKTTDTYFGGMGFSYLVPVELQYFSVE
jgi:hypothetical protein